MKKAHPREGAEKAVVHTVAVIRPVFGGINCAYGGSKPPGQSRRRGIGRYTQGRTNSAGGRRDRLSIRSDYIPARVSQGPLWRNVYTVRFSRGWAAASWNQSARKGPVGDPCEPKIIGSGFQGCVRAFRVGLAAAALSEGAFFESIFPKVLWAPPRRPRGDPRSKSKRESRRNPRVSTSRRERPWPSERTPQGVLCHCGRTLAAD